jgi:hypothetical protein
MQSHEDAPAVVREKESWEKIAALDSRLSEPLKRARSSDDVAAADSAAAGAGLPAPPDKAPAPKVRRIILKCKPWMTLLTIPGWVELANGDIVCWECLGAQEQIEYERLLAAKKSQDPVIGPLITDSEWHGAFASDLEMLFPPNKLFENSKI